MLVEAPINKLKIIIALIFCINMQIMSQGIIIRGNDKPTTGTIYEKMDPARYEKIQVFDLKLGSMYSDDRGFQQLLKYNGFEPGQTSFYTIGLNYSYVEKKLHLGIRGNLGFQNSSSKAALWHANWQGTIGKTLLRKQNNILSLNANMGVETSTIRFGDNYPNFLANSSYANVASKLFQKQFHIGPSINFNRIQNKLRIDRGLSIGFEVGINFAPFYPVWKYGYNSDIDGFIGEKIKDMPQAARQQYYASVKIGFWNAK